MADFTALKNAIQTYIKQNGNEEITGDILQEVLLSMVTSLGDSAINDLVTALANEVAARQNADGTLQQNITNEATARGNADTALGGRIDDEATARGNADTALSDRLGSTITAENTAADQIGAEAETRAAADTALQGLIDGITDNIKNGYVYAGVATPSSTPATGKVFYLALTAGTYTNFGNTVVSQGINILKYNGSVWSLDAFIGIDDELTPSSNNLPKSGNVLENIIKNGSAFDLSAYNAEGGVLATYADLGAALAALNLLPAVYKQGGMSFRFVQTSDNKYVQFMYKLEYENTTAGNNAFVNPYNWEKINLEEEVNEKASKTKVNAIAENVSELLGCIKPDAQTNKFYITDADGYVIGYFDASGLHVTSVEVVKNGTLSNVLSLIPAVVQELGTSITNVMSQNAVKIAIDNVVSSFPKLDIINDNKDTLYITDGNGYVVMKVDSNGLHATKLNGAHSVSLMGKKVVGCGDSLSVNGYYESDLCALTGAIYGGVISEGGRVTVPGEGTSMQSLIKDFVEDETPADVLIMENVNDVHYSYSGSSSSPTKKGSISDTPFFARQTVTYDGGYLTADAARAAWTNNFATIIATATTQTKGTLFLLKYTTTKIILTVGSSASTSGTIVVTIGSTPYPVAVTAGMTANEVAAAINEWDFVGYTHKCTNNIVELTLQDGYTLDTVSFDAGGTGVTLTDSTSTGDGYVKEFFMGYTAAEFAVIDNWQEAVPSLYSLYKGEIEYLQEERPSLRIIWFCPTVWQLPYEDNPRPEALTNPDGSWNMYKIYNGTWNYSYFKKNIFLREIQAEVAGYYGIECVDAMKDSCITPFNMENYYLNSNVHPLRITYTKWAELLSRQIG